MVYESESLALDLKAARERRGLSQRALSSRSGIPQSHISKIENGGVNLTISSLTALANALDLEVVLVPRKAAPATRKIASSLGDTPATVPDADGELARITKHLEHINELDLFPSYIDHLQSSCHGLRSLKSLIGNAVPLSRIADSLQAAATSGNAQFLREALQLMNNLRSTYSHAGTEDVPDFRPPAYQLDEDADE